MERKDYYSILGVPKNATQADIKKAYRKLAKEHHPDRGGDAEKFKELSEANEILSDPQKKEEYDNPASHFSNNPFGMGFSFDDIAQEFMFGGGRRGRPQQMDFLRVGVKIPINEAYNGAHKKITYQREVINGEIIQCSTCKGKGYSENIINMGFGRIASSRSTCSRCKGQGTYYPKHSEPVTVDLEIPKGCPEGLVLNYNGMGNEVSPSKFGDMLLIINTEPIQNYDRNGQDLICDLMVPLPKLLLGGDLMIDIFDSKYKIQLKRGKDVLQTMRLKGRGFQYQKESGDLYIRIIPEIPAHLNDTEKHLLSELLKQEHFSHLGQFQ